MSGRQEKRNRRERVRDMRSSQKGNGKKLILPGRFNAQTDEPNPNDSYRRGRRVNAYICEALHAIVTVDRDSGTTPMFTQCPKCDKPAASRMYRVNQDIEPTHEWYAPNVEEWRALELDAVTKGASDGIIVAMNDHRDKGGLFLRPIGGGVELVLEIGERITEVTKDGEKQGREAAGTEQTATGSELQREAETGDGGSGGNAGIDAAHSPDADAEDA